MSATARLRASEAEPSAAPAEQAEQAVPFQLLRLDGTLAAGQGASPLAGRELLGAYRLMLLTRMVNDRAVNLQRQGRIGTIASAHGQEAAIVGSAWALNPASDWVVPQYREVPALLRMGLPLARALLYFRGHPLGSAIPEGVNALPIQIALAAQVPHAVGLAWGLSLQGSDGVVLTYFGEGSSSEGDIHEAMNLAGVMRAPVIFLLQDNGWAISTPRSKQTAAASLAVRAAGYGFPGELVDGNDLLAVYDATRRAVERARAGEGPTLIEARTYRMGPHNTADDHTRYVDSEDLEAQTKLDPLIRVRGFLTSAGLLEEESERLMVEEITHEIAAAVSEMEAVPTPGVDQLFENVYAEPTERMVRQRDAAREAGAR